MSPKERTEESRFEPTEAAGIFRDRRSGIYYMRSTELDQDLQSVWVDRSLKTTKLSEAKDRAKRIRAKLSQGEDAGVKRGTWDAAFDLIIAISKPQAGKTHEQIKGIVNDHLRPFFTKPDAPTLKTFERDFEEVWARYRTEAPFTKLKEGQDPSERKPRKLEHDRRFLVMALKRARVKGWIKRDFSKKDFKLNEVHEPVGQYIETDSVRAMLKALEPHPKTRLQVLIAVTMGMRISEILHLQKREIDLRRREIDLNPDRVKTRKRREVPIPINDDVYPLLKAAVEAAPGPFIFPAQYTSRPGQPVDPNKPQDDNRYHWEKVREETGVECRFHDLRHTAITNLLKSGVPDFAVRKICGVSEATMRRIYAHIERETQAKFREALRGFYV